MKALKLVYKHNKNKRKWVSFLFNYQKEKTIQNTHNAFYTYPDLGKSIANPWFQLRCYNTTVNNHNKSFQLECQSLLEKTKYPIDANSLLEHYQIIINNIAQLKSSNLLLNDHSEDLKEVQYSILETLVKEKEYDVAWEFWGKISNLENITYEKVIGDLKFLELALSISKFTKNTNSMFELLKLSKKLNTSGSFSSTQTIPKATYNGPVIVSLNLIDEVKNVQTPSIRHVSIKGETPVFLKRVPQEVCLATQILGVENFLLVTYMPQNVARPSKTDLKIFTQGIKVDDNVYRFIGNTNGSRKRALSQGKTCYFYKGTKEEICEIALAKLSDFDECKTITDRSKRTGLFFTGLKGAIPIYDHEVQIIPDIQCKDSQVFTDGCGLISPLLAKHLVGAKQEDQVPSALQIRYKGVKGMVSTHPKLKNRQLLLRPSMVKLARCPSITNKIEIDTQNLKGDGKWSFLGYHNDSAKIVHRPAISTVTINLLMARGILPETLIDEHKKAVQIDNCTDILKWLAINDKQDVIEALCNSDNNIIKYVDSTDLNSLKKDLANSDISAEAKKQMTHLIWLKALTRGKLRMNQVKFTVPQSWNLYGVPEPLVSTDLPLLGPNECIVKINNGHETMFLTGDVCVFKSPQYCPGDLLVYKGVVIDDERFNCLSNCIIFPVTGKAPGVVGIADADFDGDKFFVIANKNIIPRDCEPAYDYKSLRDDIRSTSIPATEITNQSNLYIDLISHWMKQDTIFAGLVNKTYMAFAKSPDFGPKSAECKRLHVLFYYAINNKVNETLVAEIRELSDRSLELRGQNSVFARIDGVLQNIPYDNQYGSVLSTLTEGLVSNFEKTINELENDEEFKFLYSIPKIKEGFSKQSKK